MRHWYLVHTKPRRELAAVQNLQRQGFEIYLPLIKQPRRLRGRWLDVVEPLFTRYLFIRLDLGCDHISPIRSTVGVCNLVRFSEEPAVVPDGIIQSLQAAADASTGLHQPRNTALAPGDRVIIDTGPLAGLTAVFLEEDGQQRALILLDMLGGQKRIQIKRDRLVPV